MLANIKRKPPLWGVGHMQDVNLWKQKKVQGKKPSGKADWALNHIQKLYRIETQIKDKPIDERYQKRQEISQLLLKQFEQWLIKSEQQVLPKTKLGEAIQYCLNQWKNLNATYLMDN